MAKAPKAHIEGVSETPEVAKSVKAAVAETAPSADAAPAAKPETRQAEAKRARKVIVDIQPEPDAESTMAAASEAAENATPATGVAPAGKIPLVSGIATGHEYALLGGLAGLLVAVLVFVVGFWRALFVTLLVVVGVAIGQLADGDPKIINLIRRVIDEGRGNDL